MRKVIAGINMTIDGFCDHTYGVPDDEIHQHYDELLRKSGVALYGRITYQLMQYWQEVLAKPTGNKATDGFAEAMDKIPKVVFSHTLKDTGWDTASLATKSFEQEILELKQQPGKDILIGSPSLIVAAMNLNLADEYQLCIHPVVAGKGLPLFKNINEMSILKLTNTKTFSGGAVIHYYAPTNKGEHTH